MKNYPDKTIPEIASEFLSRVNLEVDHVRNSRDEESCWVVYMSSIAAKKAGWGLPAIARYFGRDHSSIDYLLKQGEAK